MRDAADIVRSVGSSRGMGRSLTGEGTWVSRAVWAVLLVASGAVLLTAAWLSPDPAGHGTHTQLGLPPCGFLVMTGLPCPGCGLTTSFTHMIRLQLGGAWEANPFGIFLFLLTAATAFVSVGGLARGWPVVRVLDRLHFEKVMIALGAGSLLVWGARMGVWIIG